MAYDYKEAIKQDIRDYLNGNEEIDSDTDFRELENRLNDELYCDDSITGNGSRSYTFNRETAKEYVNENTDLLKDLCDKGLITKDQLSDWFTGNEWFIGSDWKAIDVSIRCMLLPECLHEVLEEKREELEETESLDDDNALGKD